MKPPGRRVAIVTTCLAVGVLAVAGWLLRRELVLWYHFAPLGRNAQGYLEYRHRQTGIIFVSLPGGKFWMGAQATDPKGRNYDPLAESDERPVHEVSLKSFLIGKYEITQSQWMAVLGKNPSGFQGDSCRPVDNVSWYDIQEFLGKTGLLLPTEAQWEYACRAGTTGQVSGTGNLEEMSWYAKNSGGTTHRVGQKAANQFGLHDMYGNAFEWCQDLYDEGLYGKSEAQEVDPISHLCSDPFEHRVVRGGAWDDHLSYCRSANRSRIVADDRSRALGFRAAWRFQ